MAWTANSFSDFSMISNSVVGKKPPSRATRFNQQTPQHQQQHLQQYPRDRISKLGQLQVGSTANVIGIVIAKESPKSIFTKKGSGSERFLLGFVIRDTPAAFVNCTVWGSENYISDLSRSFCIGDVVKLENVQVQSNASDGSDEKFRVSTPLGFHLTMSENHSNLSMYNGLDMGSYVPLLYIPTKPSSDYYTLEDVLVNGQNLNGEHINLLVAVRKVGPVRDITTKTEKHTRRCEVKLFDESCPSFPLVLWGEEPVECALTWSPVQTVLFIADVRMNYDDFRSSMVATADSKTVFTVNPETVDAKCLYQYAQTQNFSLEDDETGKSGDLPLDQIKDVVVIEQLTSTGGQNCLEYGQLYGVITKLDLDADNVDQFFRRKCSRCKQIVTFSNNFQCTNPDCTQGALAVFNTTGQLSMETPELEFSIPITISDHTGSIHSRLNDHLLETLTGFKGKDFIQLPVEQRTQMKWNLLMERCKFYIKVLKNFRQPERQTYRVLACSKDDPIEMKQNICR